MRVAHVVSSATRLRRSPDELLVAWPTLTQVAAAARSESVEVFAVVAHHDRARRRQRSTDVHFTPAPHTTLRELKPDVLHVHGLHFARATRALHRYLPGVPVIVQDHGGGQPRAYQRAFMRWGLRHVRGALFTAREQAEPYRAMLPADVRIFEALENSTEFTPGDASEARRNTGLYGDPCVLWIGRLIAGKDPFPRWAQSHWLRSNCPTCSYGAATALRAWKPGCARALPAILRGPAGYTCSAASSTHTSNSSAVPRISFFPRVFPRVPATRSSRRWPAASRR
jgi:hypothetical protein